MTKTGVKGADLVARIKGLDGVEKEYRFVPLTRRDAVQVFHESLQVILRAISGASGALQVDKTSLRKSTIEPLKALEGLSRVDFETVWALAEKLLAWVVIDGETFEDINQTDYFGDNPDEIYLAVYHAVSLNYPKVFSGLPGLLAGFGQSTEGEEKAESDTPSTH